MTLVIADNMSGGLWLSLDPGRFYEVNPTAAMNVIYETLYHIPDAGKPDQFEPLLADGMPELSADGLEATIKLRPGVKFHTTGNEMTAADWVFSWNRLKNIKAAPSYLTTYWTQVEAVDATTLKITLPSPNPALIAILSSTPLSVTDSATVRSRAAPTRRGPTNPTPRPSGSMHIPWGPVHLRSPVGT
jgi:peptide/nickel transport system substrate-binding protein